MQSGQKLSLYVNNSPSQAHKGSGVKKGGPRSPGAMIRNMWGYYRIERQNKADAKIKFNRILVGDKKHCQTRIMENDPGSGAGKSLSIDSSNSLQLDS